MLCLQSWKVSLKPSPLEKGSLINFKVRMPLVIRHKRYIIGTEGDGSAVMAQEVAEKNYPVLCGGIHRKKIRGGQSTNLQVARPAPRDPFPADILWELP